MKHFMEAKSTHNYVLLTNSWPYKFQCPYSKCYCSANPRAGLIPSPSPVELCQEWLKQKDTQNNWKFGMWGGYITNCLCSLPLREEEKKKKSVVTVFKVS